MAFCDNYGETEISEELSICLHDPEDYVYGSLTIDVDGVLLALNLNYEEIEALRRWCSAYTEQSQEQLKEKMK